MNVSPPGAIHRPKFCGSCVCAFSGVHVVPSKRYSAPAAPATYTLVADDPHTAYRSARVGRRMLDHEVPLYRYTVPAAPTAYTLLAELPHTAFMEPGAVT